MRRSIRTFALCLSPLLLCSNAPEDPHKITQVSVIDALMVGRYDGIMPIPELLRHGDLGVGTLDHLDGELIVLDGKPYQIRGDGQILDVPPDRSTPFAVVTPFEQDGEFACPRVTGLTALDARLNEILPQKNNFVAIRIDGRFVSLTMRSVHRQEPPYRPLEEVAKNQSVWTREDQVGTLVGIRCPAWIGGLNVPGYHWHFLSQDRKVGGHVLDCRVLEGKVRYDVCRDWEVKLEGSRGFNEADLVKDRSRELQKVESPRGDEK
jgi:acetolactate decarboxylase